MQLTNAPAKLVLPFANAGAKNTIPVASQIGIVAGAASFTDGFPPLTRTPLAAGGVPPSGLDMNGVIYELSAILRWVNAGAGFVYDGTFAADSNVGGYPKGARVARSDGLGYWLNTADNNTTDPESAGAAAAGWVPDLTNGVAAVTMTSANVTLTPLQYGKPVIVISGLLTANLNLIFPNIAGEWLVINNTTGAYTVTCKTVAGTGVVVNTAQILVGDATNIYNGNLDATALLGANVASAGGTADALTVTLASTVRSWAQIAGIPFWVRAASANATTTPTVAVNGLTAKTEVKGAGSALAAGDHAGAGHWLLMQYDATLDKVVLLNPATGVSSVTQRNKNLLINGAMRVAQAGTSQALTTSVAYGSLDGWAANQGTSANGVLAQVAGIASGFQYAAKLGRNAGGTQTGVIAMQQAIESLNSIPAQGQQVTLSFYAKAGANYSGGNLAAQVYSGTGTDQAVQNVAGGWTNSALVLNAAQAITTTTTRYTFTGTVGASATQLGVYFGYTPSGTAGADDNVYITGVQLEISPSASAFDFLSMQHDVALCERQYELQTYVNMAVIGVGQAISASGARLVLPFRTRKRAVPSVAVSGSGTVSTTSASGVANVGGAISSANNSLWATEISFGGGSNMTAGNSTEFLAAPSQTAYFAIDARL